MRKLGIKPVLAKRWTEHGGGLGVYRWVDERTLSWLHQFRRLRVRYERRFDIHEAFLTVGCIIICWNQLSNSFCQGLSVIFKPVCSKAVEVDEVNLVAVV